MFESLYNFLHQRNSVAKRRFYVTRVNINCEYTIIDLRVIGGRLTKVCLLFACEKVKDICKMTWVIGSGVNSQNI